MDFTIRLKNGKITQYKKVRVITITDGKFQIQTALKGPKQEVLHEDIDTLVAHIVPVRKIESMVRGQVEGEES